MELRLRFNSSLYVYTHALLSAILYLFVAMKQDGSNISLSHRMDGAMLNAFIQRFNSRILLHVLVFRQFFLFRRNLVPTDFLA